MPIEAILVLGALGIVVVIEGLLAWREDILWNSGFCLESGAPWKYITITPSGKWIYRDEQGHEMWSSYYRNPVRL